MGFSGDPITEERTAPDGTGRYRHYRFAGSQMEWSIYWHPSTGAHEIHGSIRDKWASLGWEGYGYPITDELTTPDGRGRFNHFRAVHLPDKPESSIYWTQETGAHPVYGAIRTKWAELGWERSSLGYPIDHEQDRHSGGRSQHFQGGIVSWHPETGAHGVWGLIGERWLQIGQEQFGYPITDELTDPDRIGRFNHFRAVHLPDKPESSIYWKPETGAHEVYGAIRDLYEESERRYGRLGYPIQLEKDLPGGGRVQHFERGFIDWNPQQGARKHYDPIRPSTNPPKETPTIPPSRRPTINVSQENSNMKVTGSNFRPNANIRIRLVVGQIGNEASIDRQSKGDESLDTTFPVTGVASGTTIWVSATDGTPDPSDFTGFRWSNTVLITWV